MATAALLVPKRLVEPLDRGKARLSLDKLGDALTVDGRIAEVDRDIKKDRCVRSQLRNFLAELIERCLRTSVRAGRIGGRSRIAARLRTAFCRCSIGEGSSQARSNAA